MNIAIIPARGGSRRIPRKNVKEFHGRPIIAYSIEVALACGLFDKVVVSTDDYQIAEVAVHDGATALMRPAELAADNVGTQEVMRHVLGHLTDDDDGIACCVYPCAPLLEVKTLHRAHFLLTNLYANYVVPVGMWLQDPGQFYLGRTAAFMTGEPLLGPRTVLLPIEPERAIDINTQEDWIKVEHNYATLNPGAICAH